MGSVVRCGRSFTAKETASLKTSRLTWNFIFTPYSRTTVRKANTGTGTVVVDPEVIFTPINLFKD
jgi:hypothetical protein